MNYIKTILLILALLVGVFFLLQASGLIEFEVTYQKNLNF